METKEFDYNLTIDTLIYSPIKDEYSWHDRRKNPNDLPEADRDTSCLILKKDLDGFSMDLCEYKYFGDSGIQFIGVPIKDVLAWKYMESSKKDKEYTFEDGM